VAAYAGDAISEQDVVDALGLVDRQTLFDFCETVASQDSRKALVTIKGVIESGLDVEDFLKELLDHLRILMILGTDRESHDLVNLSTSELADYLKQVEYFSVGDIIRLMKMTGDSLGDLKTGLDERLVLEVAAVKMASMESTVSFQQILAHLQQNPQAAAGGGSDLFNGGAKKKVEPGRPVESSAPADAPEETIDPSTLTRTMNLPQLRSGWDGFLAGLRRKSPMLSSQLGMAEVREVRDNKVLLMFGANGATSLQLVRKPENLQLLTRSLREHFRANLRITVDMDTSQTAPERSREQKVTDKEAIDKMVANSPRLQHLLEKVNGEIIGVRKVKE